MKLFLILLTLGSLLQAQDKVNKKHKKGAVETSLYASQKPMSEKQKYRKGTRNPGAWR